MKMLAHLATLSKIMLCTCNNKLSMILFGFLALFSMLWTLNINNQLRLLRNSSASLKTEIEDAAQSCGQSLN